MCRWLAYMGAPVAPEIFLYEEQYSLVEQSQNARKSKSVVNGDGCGLGWYGDKATPGIFKDTHPAWSDENLRSLASQIDSKLFMAHVRAATGTPANRSNCHPFANDNYLFMHNGQISGYLQIKRKLESLLPDSVYQHRIGSTDSEILFLYLIHLMENLNFTDAVEQLIFDVEAIMSTNDIEGPFRFTCAISNGEWLKTVKYSTDNFVPSLFYKKLDEGILIVSEPLNDEFSNWDAVPDNHLALVQDYNSSPTIVQIGSR